MMLHCTYHSSRKEQEERDSKGERSWKGGRKTKVITAASNGQLSARVSLGGGGEDHPHQKLLSKS